MEYLTILLTVASIWTIAAVTPGPNFFVTVHKAVGGKRRFAFYTVAGIVAGTFVWALAGFFGIAAMFKLFPMIYYTLKIMGGVYLIYIGVVFLLAKNSSHKIEKNSSTPINCFKVGMLTNLSNPKTAAFMTSLFAATIPPDASFKLGLLCVMVICFISAVWYLIVASLFSWNKARRAYQKCRRSIEKTAGVIFISFGVKLAVEK